MIVTFVILIYRDCKWCFYCTIASGNLPYRCFSSWYTQMMSYNYLSNNLYCCILLPCLMVYELPKREKVIITLEPLEIWFCGYSMDRHGSHKLNHIVDYWFCWSTWYQYINLVMYGFPCEVSKKKLNDLQQYSCKLHSHQNWKTDLNHSPHLHREDTSCHIWVFQS